MNPTPADLGVLYGLVKRAKEQLEFLETGLEAQIRSVMSTGVNVPGWISEPSQGRESWDKAPAEIFKLGDMLQIELRKEQAITPSQARKAGVLPELVAAYSSRKTGTKLSQNSGDIARKIFGDTNVS